VQDRLERALAQFANTPLRTVCVWLSVRVSDSSNCPCTTTVLETVVVVVFTAVENAAWAWFGLSVPAGAEDPKTERHVSRQTTSVANARVVRVSGI